MNFNPRSPHGERLIHCGIQSAFGRFQSTLPARGATFPRRSASCGMGYFNPRSPHGERHVRRCRLAVPAYFNPRSPHGERPFARIASRGRYLDFNPRSPHGERRLRFRMSHHLSYHFNPRSPHGERRAEAGYQLVLRNISIHAPRTGSDEEYKAFVDKFKSFQSTLPARGATPPSVRADDF